jgi:hypothetical protein
VLPVSQWSTLQTICHPDSACVSNSYQLNAASARVLSQHGISLGAFAVFNAAVYTVVWVMWYGLAALIIWRKPQDRGALLSAFFLVTFPLLFPTQGGSIPASAPVLLQFVNVVPFFALMLFGLLFPDGHFAPRWMRWLAAAGVLATIASGLLPNSNIWIIPVLLLPIAIVGVQIYRFRRVSTWDQRQQTKWALFGLVVAVLGFVALTLLSLFAPAQTANDSLYGALPVPELVISALPICIGIAVLRSRLWDIDRIISRALVYTILSITLGAIYIGSIVGLQALFRAITGQQSGLAVAISTLVMAALFNPLRNRVQDVIARTFSRRKYNAQQVLAAFGATCRNETDLEKLREGILLVVEETVQPAHVSLWLR